MAAQAGKPDSTIRGWLDSDNLISSRQLVMLLRRAGADDREVEDWCRRRDAIASPATPRAQAGAVSALERPAPARSPRMRQWLERTGLVVAGIVVGVVGTLIIAPDTEAENTGGNATTSEQGRVGNCGPVQEDLRSGSVATHITHTGNLGTWQRRGPGRNFCREQDGLSEGTPVRVVCQTLTGDLVESRRENGDLVRSTVWDKLDSGMWIPHIFTDLPMTDGSTLVAGLDRC
jgi:hypothetical protein